MEAGAFWSEVRRRKNQFFLAALSWLVIGRVLFLLLLGVLPSDLLSGYGAIFTWTVSCGGCRGEWRI